jgi:hypothetical protein
MGRRSQHILQLCDLACKPVITHFSVAHFIPVTEGEITGSFKAGKSWTSATTSRPCRKPDLLTEIMPHNKRQPHGVMENNNYELRGNRRVTDYGQQAKYMNVTCNWKSKADILVLNVSNIFK